MLLLSIKAGVIASIITMLILWGLAILNSSDILDKINIHPTIKNMIKGITKNKTIFINIAVLSFIVTIFAILFSNPKCKSVITA